MAVALAVSVDAGWLVSFGVIVVVPDEHPARRDVLRSMAAGISSALRSFFM